MIQVYLSDLSFQYDVHSLIKAFYQEEDVTVSALEQPGPSYTGFVIREQDAFMICSYYKDGQQACDETRSPAGEDRAETKSALKRSLYDLLVTLTGKSLPWGTLTGIRPVKLAMKMLSEGAPDEEIRAFMAEKYLVSDEKISLATEIAKRENGIIKSVDAENGFSLYIGIPFCPTTCMYCSFTSYPIGRFKHLTDDYLLALERELALVADVFAGRKLTSIYIGGGTPTTLEPAQMLRLQEVLDRYFDCGSALEYTMEAGRPDSITAEKLRTMLAMGINRISVNPQTMQDDTLKLIGRRHTVKQTVEAFLLAREIGLHNINMDIILGLPGEDIGMVRDTLSQIRELGPDSLTVHSMAIKRAAAMHDFLTAHPELKSTNTPEMMDLTAKAASDMGMHPYYLYRQKNMAGNFENVGYAKEGMYGIYNILIMEEVQPIAAVGAGTISKVIMESGRIERCDTIKDVDLYLRSVDQVIDKKREFYNAFYGK